MTRKRADLGFGDNISVLSDVKTKPRKRPDSKQLNQIAEETGFGRRIKSEPSKGETTKRVKRSRREPRNEQIAVRTTTKYYNMFYELVDVTGSAHVASVFEEAITLMAEKYKLKIENDS